MERALVIVESLAKARTIGKHLGPEYQVLATNGHILGLPENALGVEIGRELSPSFVAIQSRADDVTLIKEVAKNAVRVMIATDPDREGESIAWQIADVLQLDMRSKCRVIFNEISKNAIKAAIASPRHIDMNVVGAQHTLNSFDRVVDHMLSPVLGRKVSKRVSAERLHSVVTSMVVDREKEIMRFKREDHIVITAVLSKKESREFFDAHYIGEMSDNTQADKNRDSRVDPVIMDPSDLARIIAEIENDQFKVQSIKKHTKRISSAAPLTTSMLLQEASRHLGIPARKTLAIARQLYEGIELAGQGMTSLITYILTDSVLISGESIAEARRIIRKTYGPVYVRTGRSRSLPQDTCEAIRPIHFDLSPDTIQASLSKEQFLIYRLVWECFLASQMSPAIFEGVVIDITAGRHVFRANGELLRFKGFLAATGEKGLVKNDVLDEAEGKERIHEIIETEAFELLALLKVRKDAQPPLRYTEASLIKAMEDTGIGRPSNYADTISTILDRKYVEKVRCQDRSDRKDTRMFVCPTVLGTNTTKYLRASFSEYIDWKLTTLMESDLDKVARGEQKKNRILDRLFDEVIYPVENAKITKDSMEPIRAAWKCDHCKGGQLVRKPGKHGPHTECSNYPDCTNIGVIFDPVWSPQVYRDTIIGKKCPRCHKGVQTFADGSFGRLISCSRKPICTYHKATDQTYQGNCPLCGSHLVVIPSSRFRGRRYYDCDQEGLNPQCKYFERKLPLRNKICTTCGCYMVLMGDISRERILKCGNSDCPTNLLSKGISERNV
jgi:DNA topoisomerase-1